MVIKKISAFLFLFCALQIQAQLKFLVDDFEGMDDGAKDVKSNGFFTYGDVSATVDSKTPTGQTYSGRKCMRVEKTGKQEYGGWGKGITLFVQLDASTDFLNFYVYQPASNKPTPIKIEIQDDDDEDNNFNKDRDDSWWVTQTWQPKNGWELISIPLSSFKDGTYGGDGKLNMDYQTGKILGIMFSFADAQNVSPRQTYFFDFISFSKGKLPTGGNIFEPPPAAAQDFCTLGAWSYGEGQLANFSEIAKTFEGQFGGAVNKKIGIVHFFQPFGKDDGSSTLYPSAERINKVIEMGYIPMITLENHFVAAGGGAKINLYSIVDGHFDSFLGYWAHLIKQVKGTVLLRILHEFNGDWYDWCTVKNDKNPELVVRTFRYIHGIFNQNNVTNVKFIWCPNSMSVPQEKWNYIMYAYPGDEWVDFVALDIYNGAGNNSRVWRSFRKEGIENYFILTQQLPHKPLLICETASRERSPGEQGPGKGEWIRETSVALKTDMSKIRLFTWFNQTDPFKLTSSKAATEAFVNYIMKDPFFRSGAGEFQRLLK